MKVLGREFQEEGAEKQKLRFPNRFDRVRGMRSIPDVQERKKMHDGSDGSILQLLCNIKYYENY